MNANLFRSTAGKQVPPSDATKACMAERDAARAEVDRLRESALLAERRLESTATEVFRVEALAEQIESRALAAESRLSLATDAMMAWQERATAAEAALAEAKAKADDRLAEMTALDATVARLRGALESFVDTAEAAVRAHETKDDGGMRVSFHGDFAGAQPSVISRLRWWARHLRAALEAPPGGEEAIKTWQRT